ncbi:MAG: bifunctional hydroxymethylpyrimidine kinase/phosphomethylpyrimidine kinase [Candidatus Methylomirabilia bacterium]
MLCIAGVDSAGCSGIAADLRTVAALGGHGQLAVTAVTAQDTLGVHAVAPVSARLVRAQIAAVLGDAGTDAIKIGMLANAAVVRAVAGALARAGRARVVLDPVLRSTTGRRLLDAAGHRALVARLLPLADLITPNLPEAEALLGHPIRGLAGTRAAARQLLDLGPRAVLVKGGHRRGAAVDVFADAGGTLVLSTPRIASVNTRGTGCVLSTACACLLAQGLALPEAVRGAKAFVTAAIRHSYRLGRGPGPVNPTAAGRPGARMESP